MRMMSGAFLTAVCCAGLALAGGQRPGQPARSGQPNKAEQPKAGTDQQARFDADRFLKDHDKNMDGKLSKEELPKNLQEGFAELDMNKDSAISADELRKHVAKMADQRPQVIEVLYWVIDIPEQEPASTEELQRAYELLRKMDADNNGKLESGEVNAFRDQREKQRLDEIFQALDRNNDSKIAKDEARGLWADNFAELDRNSDGNLDRQEIQAACRMKKDGGKGTVGEGADVGKPRRPQPPR